MRLLGPPRFHGSSGQPLGCEGSALRVVRSIRTGGEEAVITVDGEPAARVVAVQAPPRSLTPAEVASFRALMGALPRFERPASWFDAVALVREGRR